MVGSEGTLGFVSKVTYNTVPDYKDKASAFIIFSSVEDAAVATHHLREAGCTGKTPTRPIQSRDST